MSNSNPKDDPQPTASIAQNTVLGEVKYKVYRRVITDHSDYHVLIGCVSAKDRNDACLQFRDGEFKDSFLTARIIHISSCDECNGIGEAEKNIWRGEEGMQIEIDVMVVCSECNGTGVVEL